MAKKISFRSIGSECRLQVDRAFRDNALARRESLDNSKTGIVPASKLDRCRTEASWTILDEHRVLFADLHNSRDRHPNRGDRRSRVVQTSEHLRTQPAQRIIQFAGHFDSARFGLNHVGDSGYARPESFTWIGDQFQFDGTADVAKTDRAFR